MPTKAPKPIPEGMHSITIELWYNGNCKEAIDFYKKAFNATQRGDTAFGPDGNVLFLEAQLGERHSLLRVYQPKAERALTFAQINETVGAGDWTLKAGEIDEIERYLQECK